MPMSEKGSYGAGGIGCLAILLAPLMVVVIIFMLIVDSISTSQRNAAARAEAKVDLPDGTYALNLDSNTPWGYSEGKPVASWSPGTITYQDVVAKGTSVTTHAYLTNTGQDTWQVDCEVPRADERVGYLWWGPGLNSEGGATSEEASLAWAETSSCLVNGSASLAEVPPGGRVDLVATYRNGQYLTRPVEIGWHLCHDSNVVMGAYCWYHSLPLASIEQYRSEQ